MSLLAYTIIKDNSKQKALKQNWKRSMSKNSVLSNDKGRPSKYLAEVSFNWASEIDSKFEDNWNYYFPQSQ